MLGIYLRLLAYVRPYAFGMVVAILCMAVLSGTTMVYAFLSGPLLSALIQGQPHALEPITKYFPALADAVAKSDRMELLMWVPFIMLGVALVKGVAYAGQFILIRGIGQRVMADLRQQLFDKMVSLPPSFHETRQRGDLMARFTSDVQQVEQSVTDASADAIRHLLQIVGLVIQALFIDWQLAAVCFISVPATFYPVSRFGKFIKRVASDAQKRVGTMTAMVQETLHGIKVVQAFGGEARAREEYRQETQRFVKTMDRSVVARGLYSPTMEILGVVGVLFLLRYAGGRITNGDLKPEDFISFLTSMFLLYGPIKAIGKLSNYVITGVVSAERLFEIMDTVPAIQDSPSADQVGRLKGEVEVRNVSFSFGMTQVLHGLNLHIKPGECVAVVGPSGSGKTTLLNLLLRFMDVESGAVLLDGMDVRSLRTADIRANMALVTQDTVLFHATVRDNIGYGRAGASQVEIDAAAKAAHAMDFIKHLPGGMDCMLGENGVNLSGGQRQRLAIARALVRNAPILILDEATSALDTESEFHVQAALQNLVQGRTTLMVAHRLSTVKRADRIVVMDGGAVVEMGTHEALLAKGGVYARLAARADEVAQ